MISRPAGSPGLATLEAALEKIVASRGDTEALKDAIRAKRLEKHPASTLVERGRAAGVIDEEGERRLREADLARREAITVDSFAAGSCPATEQYPTDSTATQ